METNISNVQNKGEDSCLSSWSSRCCASLYHNTNDQIHRVMLWCIWSGPSSPGTSRRLINQLHPSLLGFSYIFLSKINLISYALFTLSIYPKLQHPIKQEKTLNKNVNIERLIPPGKRQEIFYGRKTLVILVRVWSNGSKSSKHMGLINR